jgi:acyl carrier protein
MDKQQIFEQIQGQLVKLFELDADDIKPESRLYEELDLDSIDAVDLVVQLQKITDIKFKAEDFKSVRTVQDVVDKIDDLLNAKH